MKADEEKELKQAERRQKQHFTSRRKRGGKVTDIKKTETKTEKETETLRDRLYLGTPRCGGLV